MFDPQKIELKKVFFQNGFIENADDAVWREPERFTFEVGYDAGLSIENKKARSIITVTITGKGKDDDAISKAFYEIRYYFHVENLDELSEKNDDSEMVTANADLANALASITYSTTRGLVLSRLQGTPLEAFSMPVIDPNDLLANTEIKEEEE